MIKLTLELIVTSKLLVLMIWSTIDELTRLNVSMLLATSGGKLQMKNTTTTQRSMVAKPISRRWIRERS